jgi:uncharacterized damage-inducible protein DinB
MTRILLFVSMMGLFGFSSREVPSFNKEVNQSPMLHKYTAYNLWANEQIANWLKDAPEDVFNQEIESSFSTIRKTLIHIWNAEYGWLNAIKNEPWGEAPGQQFEGDGQALLQGLMTASKAFHLHVSSLSPEAIESTTTNSRGTTISIGDMIQHCMNHSTYHRGQLITMGRQAGLTTPPRTDFIYYISL